MGFCFFFCFFFYNTQLLFSCWTSPLAAHFVTYDWAFIIRLDDEGFFLWVFHTNKLLYLQIVLHCSILQSPSSSTLGENFIERLMKSLIVMLFSGYDFLSFGHFLCELHLYWLPVLCFRWWSAKVGSAFTMFSKLVWFLLCASFCLEILWM
jgi:hypothetical protein